MARVINLLENEYADRLHARRHPLLGSATVSVGVVSGGTQPNIVPDQCAILVDRRTLPRETEASVCRELYGLFRKQRLGVSIAGTKLDPCRPLETNPRLPLVSQFLRCVGQSKPAAVHYFCDAAVLAGAGIPSVVFGPGDIAQAHTADEWVSLAEVERAKELLVHYLRAC
jgi:acetylornithine deacetylase/succinyl-diaminopimelate desuccinylase-like protein